MSDLDERLERWERQVSALRRIMADAIQFDGATTYLFPSRENGSTVFRIVALLPVADCDEPIVCMDQGK